MNNHDGEIDPKGKETLQSIAVASRFNEWMYRTIKPYCKGRILEIGSGIGNISAFFIRDGFPIVLSDLNKDYCQLLHQQFEGEPGCQGITELDLVHPDFDQIYAAYLSSFDTVIALNVIEHIQDEAAAFR